MAYRAIRTCIISQKLPTYTNFPHHVNKLKKGKKKKKRSSQTNDYNAIRNYIKKMTQIRKGQPTKSKQRVGKILTGVGHGDFANLIWIEPDLAFATLEYARSEPFLKLQRHHRFFFVNSLSDEEKKQRLSSGFGDTLYTASNFLTGSRN